MTLHGSRNDCPHLQISTDRDSKPSCIECGLVQDQTPATRYVRSITHYKELTKQGIYPPVISLVGESLIRQVCKYQQRLRLKNRQPATQPPGRVVQPALYQDYVEFLKANSDKCLPRNALTGRKRVLKRIYGEHHKIISDYVAAIAAVEPAPDGVVLHSSRL